MKTIVTCNGCFDSLHPGHLFFLGFCRGQGDELYVGINSDDYIRNKKQREPVPEEKRRAALMELGFITGVTVFREPNPCQFIQSIKPQVHCTGEEYQNGTCAEAGICASLGIKLVYVPRVGDWSSTSLRKFYKSHNAKAEPDGKPMSPREKELLVKALYWRKRHDDCNPDVGIGPSLESLARLIVAGQGVTDEDFWDAIIRVGHMNG